MNRTHLTRRGVTLVELLVAAAMCIMGMWLLSWLYQQGLESFRQARAQADLTTQLRTFTQMITRDLTADHFEREDNRPNANNGGKKLSDQRLDLMTPIQDPRDGKTLIVDKYTPPKRGYFRAGSYPIDLSANVLETDPTGFADSSRFTNHFLQFTAILPGGSNFQQFSAEVPANSMTQYFGTAAEITYYLQSNMQTAGSTPLYDLYRSQRLVARNGDDVTAYSAAVTAATAANDKEVLAITPGNKMGTLEDITFPGITGGCRFPAPFTPNTIRVSEDKLISNVISFEVKFTGSSADGKWPSKTIAATSTPNGDYPYDTLPFDGTFDTYSTKVTDWQLWTNVASDGNVGKPLKPIRITGAQIRLRIFDAKTRSTRQTTVIVDL